MKGGVCDQSDQYASPGRCHESLQVGPLSTNRKAPFPRPLWLKLKAPAERQQRALAQKKKGLLRGNRQQHKAMASGLGGAPWALPSDQPPQQLPQLPSGASAPTAHSGDVSPSHLHTQAQQEGSRENRNTWVMSPNRVDAPRMLLNLARTNPQTTLL